MEYRVLKYFLTVAQTENITKAAEILYTTQPNLSRQLANLEYSIGKKLFERGGRKVTLTEDGVFLRKRAQEIVDLMERMEEELMTSDDEPSGVIHIGATESHAMRFLAKVMMMLNKKYPKISFDIFSGSTTEVTDSLKKGMIHFGVLAEPVELRNYHYFKLPQQDILGIVMRKDSELAELPSITPDDIRGKPLLCCKQQINFNTLSSWFHCDIKNLNIVSCFNLATTPIMMVEAGLGYAFTFAHPASIGESRDLCFRPLKPKVEIGLYLVWKKGQPLIKIASAFLDQVQVNINDCPD